MSDLALGKKGEEIAKKYLSKHNYKIVERNFKSQRWGEIDLVAIENEVLVFVEVKTRLGSKYGEPQEAVTPFKLRALKRTGTYYKMQHPELPEALRIDVVAIVLDRKTHEPLKIELFRDAR